MMDSRRAWRLWLVVTLSTVPVSLSLWWIGGVSICGEEVYDTPPGSAGDTVCTALIHPIVPWALIAASPTLLVVVGGVIGIRRRHRDLFRLALVAPFFVAVVGILASLAID